MLRKWHDELVSPEEMRRISARQEDEYVVERILDDRGRIENWKKKRGPMFEVLVKWETYPAPEWHPIHRETGIGLTQAFVDYVNQGGPHFEALRRKLRNIRDLHDYCGYLIGQAEVMCLIGLNDPEEEEEQPGSESDAIRFRKRRVSISIGGGAKPEGYRYPAGQDALAYLSSGGDSLGGTGESGVESRVECIRIKRERQRTTPYIRPVLE